MRGVNRSLSYYRRVFKDIDGDETQRLYLLAGREPFIMEELAARIAAAHVPGELSEFNLTTMHGSEADMESFVSAARSYPFLAEKRVLVIRELERMRGKWKKLVEYAADPSPSSVVVLIFNTHDESGRRVRPPREYRALEKAVAAAGKVLTFDRLDEKSTIDWAVRKARGEGVELDPAAAAVLARNVGGNLYDVKNEIDKLALLFEGGTAGPRELAAVLGSYRVDAVWDLLDRVLPGKEREALGTLGRIISTGAEKPSVVLYHLIRHFLSLLKVKAGYAGSGWTFDRLRRQAGRFKTRAILVWLENLRLAEITMKRSSMPEDALLVGTILHSMRGERMEIRSVA